MGRFAIPENSGNAKIPSRHCYNRSITTDRTFCAEAIAFWFRPSASSVAMRCTFLGSSPIISLAMQLSQKQLPSLWRSKVAIFVARRRFFLAALFEMKRAPTRAQVH